MTIVGRPFAVIAVTRASSVQTGNILARNQRRDRAGGRIRFPFDGGWEFARAGCEPAPRARGRRRAI